MLDLQGAVVKLSLLVAPVQHWSGEALSAIRPSRRLKSSIRQSSAATPCREHHSICPQPLTRHSQRHNVQAIEQDKETEWSICISDCTIRRTKQTMRLAQSPERGTHSDTMRKIMTRIQLMSVKIQMMVVKLPRGRRARWQGGRKGRGTETKAANCCATTMD